MLSHCSYTLIQQARHGIQIVLTSPLTPCADDWIIFGTTSSALTSVSFIRTLARRQGRKGCPAWPGVESIDKFESVQLASCR